MAFVATNDPPDCVSFSALLFVLQLSVLYLPFLQKVHLYSGAGALVQNLVMWSLTLNFYMSLFCDT